MRELDGYYVSSSRSSWVRFAKHFRAEL